MILLTALRWVEEQIRPPRGLRASNAHTKRQAEARELLEGSTCGQALSEPSGGSAISDQHDGALAGLDRKPIAVCPNCNRWAQDHKTRPFRFVCIWDGTEWEAH